MNLCKNKYITFDLRSRDTGLRLRDIGLRLRDIGLRLRGIVLSSIGGIANGFAAEPTCLPLP